MKISFPAFLYNEGWERGCDRRLSKSFIIDRLKRLNRVNHGIFLTVKTLTVKVPYTTIFYHSVTIVWCMSTQVTELGFTFWVADTNQSCQHQHQQITSHDVRCWDIVFWWCPVSKVHIGITLQAMFDINVCWWARDSALFTRTDDWQVLSGVVIFILCATPAEAKTTAARKCHVKIFFYIVRTIDNMSGRYIICPDLLLFCPDNILIRPDDILIRPDDILIRLDNIVIRPGEILIRPDDIYEFERYPTFLHEQYPIKSFCLLRR